jgi:hypothetical protein
MGSGPTEERSLLRSRRNRIQRAISTICAVSALPFKKRLRRPNTAPSISQSLTTLHPQEVQEEEHLVAMVAMDISKPIYERLNDPLMIHPNIDITEHVTPTYERPKDPPMINAAPEPNPGTLIPDFYIPATASLIGLPVCYISFHFFSLTDEGISAAFLFNGSTPLHAYIKR